jgi:hypothetical protein
MEVIHDWDDEHAERILRTVQNAAPAGSKILLVEAMMPDAHRPCWTTTLDVIILNLLGGRHRSLPEFTVLLNKCGFDEVREIPLEQATLLFTPDSRRCDAKPHCKPAGLPVKSCFYEQVTGVKCFFLHSVVVSLSLLLLVMVVPRCCSPPCFYSHFE